VEFTLWHERVAVRPDALTNAVRTSDPAGAPHDQQQLIESRRVRADASTRSEVKSVGMRLTDSMGDTSRDV